MLVPWDELATSLGYGCEKQMLITLYQQNTAPVIAKYLGVSRTGLIYRLRKHNIPVAERGWASPMKPNPLKHPPARRNIHDVIDEWHNSDRDVSLHEHLGMTWTEYAEFVRTGDIPEKFLHLYYED